MKLRTFSLYYLPVVLWMCLIFYLSDQDKQQSTNQMGLFQWLLSLVFDNPRQLIKGTPGLLIRKAAHLTEYGILFLLLFRALRLHLRYTAAVVYGILGCALYGLTDEFHQLTVYGRTGQLSDVIIDTAGAFLGFLIHRVASMWNFPPISSNRHLKLKVQRK
ncbi:MAG: VanZ family protein [Bacteroidota bacterium]